MTVRKSLLQLGHSAPSFLFLSPPAPRRMGRYNASPFFPFIQNPSHPFQTQTSSPLLQSDGKSPHFSGFPESTLKISILNFESMDIVYNADKHCIQMLRDWILFGVCVREYRRSHEMSTKQSTHVKTSWGRSSNIEKKQIQICNLGKIPH